MAFIQIKKDTIIAGYIAMSAYIVGGIAAVGPYACPTDSGWQRVGISIFAGVTWPLVQAVTVLGYTPRNTKCVDGSPYIRPPQDR